MDKDTKYYWLLCKVCGKLHRGDKVPPPAPMFVTMRKTGRLECPDNPGRSAEYTLEDWMIGTEEEAEPDSTRE